MNVLLIAHKNPFPPNDGGNMGIYTMIDGLLLNGLTLDVLLMNPIKLFKPLNLNLVPSNIRKIEAVTINTNPNIFAAFMNLLQKESYFITRFYDQQFEKKLIEFLSKNNYDIIQLESIFSAVYLPIIKKYSKAKIVLSAHNIEYQIWQRVLQHESNRIKKWYLELQSKRLKEFEHKVFEIVDGITAVTELDKVYIQSLYPQKKMVVTPNGMDVEKFKLVPFEQQDLNTIFYLGSLDWIPNQQSVVWFLNQVWPLVLQKKPQLQLIIAGKNIPDWLMSRKDPNTRFYSNVPDTRELYDKYAIMIVPLLAGSGIRVRIIEGMAYGKCIVSTRIGSEGIPYEHQKNIVIADTPEEFAQAIIDLNEHPEKVREIQRNARQTAEQFYDRKNVYLPLVKMYNELVNAT